MEGGVLKVPTLFVMWLSGLVTDFNCSNKPFNFFLYPMGKPGGSLLGDSFQIRSLLLCLPVKIQRSY